MISISLDLGNAPSVLAALRNQENAQLVVNKMAEVYVSDTHDWIKAGNAYRPRTGALQQSVDWHPAGNGSAEVYANADYAGFVEFGTQPHVIEPKSGRKGLKVTVPGVGYIVGRSINHPGSKAYPYFFSDTDNRQQHMQERALSVLAARLAQAS